MSFLDAGLLQQIDARTVWQGSADPNDPRIGDLIRFDQQEYESAQIVIIGCPQDDGVYRNGGRPGAAQAPDVIRGCLCRLSSQHLSDLHILDAGNVIIRSTLEETHEIHHDIVERVLQDHKRLIVLGGGNDISYPDCAALASVYENILAINIDAHFDVRESARRHSGTPYRQLLTNGFLEPANFYEVGYQEHSNSETYLNYLNELGVNVISRDDLRSTTMRLCLEQALHQSVDAIFWGFDLDVVRSAEAPGVSAPNVNGISGDELCVAAEIAGADARSYLVEFSEVNPKYDVDLRTSRLTAVAIYRYLKAFASIST